MALAEFPQDLDQPGKIPLSRTAKPKILSACPRIMDSATPIHKPHQDRSRQEVCERAQAKKACRDTYQPRKQGQHRR